MMNHVVRALAIIQLAAALGCGAEPAASSPLEIRLASPLDFQVAQRGTRAEGTILVAGAILPESKGELPVDRLEARLVGKDLSGQWQALAFDPRVSAFRAALAAPAGGWYRLEVRALRRAAVVAAAVVEHVGVGEVFVVAGQSNSANYGEERQTNQTGLVSAFDGAAWSPAGDPEPGAGGKGGSFLPPMGDLLATRFHVPIGLVALGIGSTSVREWLPSGVRLTNLPPLTRNVVTVGPGQWESSGAIFRNFTARLRSLGPHGFRAVLWHQGESDAHQAEADRTLPGELYRQCLERLIGETHREIGWEAPWFVAQASYHGPNDLASPDIRAAQKALWDAGIALPGPDSDTLTGSMRASHGTGVHLSGAGLRAHGRLWADKISPWLERQLDGH
jgi:hypothetical protein